MTRAVTPPSAEPFLLSSADRRALLLRARDAVARVVAGDGAPTDEAPASPALARPGAVFVTLHVDGELRGCIGTSEPRAPLWRAVSEMARAAATRDPRFSPIAARDLGALSVEISVLSPERRLGDPSEIEIGRHGLDVRRRLSHGLLLPQVAVEHGFDRERFLAETCRKAGLPADAWKDPATEVRTFEADVFAEGASPLAEGASPLPRAYPRREP
jgi:AmmeMemoRadiSam system protein A